VKLKTIPTKLKPNILWICPDQQRFDTIGALGNPHINTPNIDGLVEEGVAFSHAYVQTPICAPSRASFLTGMYPSSVHACKNGSDYWANNAPLVTKILADDGYKCGLAGKLHLSGTQTRVEPRPDDGYQIFHWSNSPGNIWPQGHDYADWLKSKGEDLGELGKHPEDIPPNLHQTTWCADKAIELIEATTDQPWLMSVNMFDPHPPFDPPKEYLDRYDAESMPDPLFQPGDLEAQAKLKEIDFESKAQNPEEFNIREIKAAYYAMIELIDENVGRMLDALERTGQRENTIIIYTSDHGESLGDHGLLLKGCRFYEGLVRVPLIFSWPGYFQSGLVSNALVELIDVTPTLLDICGLPKPERMQGRSLLPILTGVKEPHQHREFVRSEYYRALKPLNKPDSEGSYGTMIRDKRYKLIVYHGYDIGELFDLETDPGEFQNLWDDPNYGTVRNRLMKKSFDALAFAVDTGPKRISLF
jgi:arylsulfatase